MKSNRKQGVPRTSRSTEPRTGRGTMTRRTLLRSLLSAVVLPFVNTAWAQQALPAWLQGVPIGGWIQIPNTAIRSVQPNPLPPFPAGGSPDGKVRAWVGFTLDPRTCTLWSVANGGHNDYSGNEADAIRLIDDVPAWVQKAPPSTTVGSDQAVYPDGRPASRHSYYGTVFSTVANRVFLPTTPAPYGPGGAPIGATHMSGFNVLTNTYDSQTTYPNAPDGGVAGFASSALDPRSGDIYHLTSFLLLKWTNATNRWSTANASFPLGGIYTASTWDSTRNLALFFANGVDEPGGARAVTYSPDTGTTTTRNYSGPQAGQPNSAGEDGITYAPALDAFLVQKGQGGGTVYRINASTMQVDTFPTTGGSTIPSLASDGTQGVFTRWQYCPPLGGVVYCPIYGSNLWFLRTNFVSGPAPSPPPAPPMSLRVQ